MNIEKYISELTDGLVASWWRQQCREPYAALYLYYKGSKVEIAQENPGGWSLWAERIPPSLSQYDARIKIYKILRQLPILPVEEKSE